MVAPDQFVDALKDDLNTHKALELMTQYRLTGNRVAGLSGGSVEDIAWVDDAQASEAVSKLVACGNLIGIDLQPSVTQLLPEQEKLISARNAARAAKNFAESDRIRDELAAMGIALKDNKDGTTSWEANR